MNVQTSVFTMFKEGKSRAEIIEAHSRKSYYRYIKLWNLVRISDKINWLIFSGSWENCYTPNIKQILKEVRKWR